jgi:hypothetical protein
MRGPSFMAARMRTHVPEQIFALQHLGSQDTQAMVEVAFNGLYFGVNLCFL